MAASRVLVFGISGATWEVVEPLARAGRLPVLASLLESGSLVKLVSEALSGDLYPRPQIAWATIATGCVPEGHGVTRFYHEGVDLQRPAIWDHVAHAGGVVGVFGWPVTWPPPSLAGFVIPSHYARDDATTPPELAWIRRIDRRQQSAEREASRAGHIPAGLTDIRSFLVTARQPLRTAARLGAMCGRATVADDEERALLLRFAKLEAMSSIFRGLCDRYRPAFAAYVTFLVDFASHRYWHHMEEPHPYKKLLAEAVPEAYTRTDRALGRMLTELRPDAVFVVSEHGMASERVRAEVGTVRYLLKGSAIHALAGLAPDVVPHPIARWLTFRRADGPLPSETADRLRRLRIRETGRPLLEVHVNGAQEAVARLSLRDVDQQSLANGRLTVEAEGKRVPFSQVTRPLGRTRSAMHTEDAILVAAGRRIKAGVSLEGVPLVDVAPTITRACGIDNSGAVDGQPLVSLFSA